MKPKTYDINYYRGDDFTIMVFPKDSTGANIPIGTAIGFFNVASGRGDNPDWKGKGVAAIQPAYANGPDGVYCTLSSSVGQNISNGYVYDIGYTLGGKRTTLLTGRFVVIDWVEN